MLPSRLLIPAFGLCLAILANSAGAQDFQLAERVNQAIDKGTAFLKKYSEDGNVGRKRPATWALRGWALLETGVPKADDVVQTLAAYVREQVPEMDKVYDLALSVIFLDKLADPLDDPLIEALAVRLLAGQSNRGGWDYAVELPDVLERARLSKRVKDNQVLRSQGAVVKIRPRTPQEITRDVARQLSAIKPSSPDFLGDNSNTQFAMLAVWVGRRRGLPVQASLQLVERRFQVSQVQNGAWGYLFPQTPPATDDGHFTYPAMTCAGLLGLALGEGVRAKPRDLLKEAPVQRGLAVLAGALTETPPQKRLNFIYFLFSMERMAVVYNLKKIGAHDWYLWGARKLVDRQLTDGSWQAGFGADAADTCLALLFLKRANVAPDLTDILQIPARKASRNKGGAAGPK